jgi:hypothetical protein
MRKKAIVILALWIVSGIFVFNGCKGKLPELEKEKAVNLIKKINAAPIGLQIEADPSAIEITADSKSSKRAPRYFIAISGPKISFDSSAFKETNFPLPEFVLDFDCEKVVLHYGPEETYLGLASVSGLSFEMNTQDFLRPPVEKMKTSTREIPKAIFKFSYGELSLDQLNISPILEESATLSDFVSKVASLNQSVGTKLEKFNVEINTETEKTGSHQIKISVDNILSGADIDPNFVQLIYSKAEESREKLEELLKEPGTLFDVSLDAEGISFSYKKDGKQKAEVILEKVKFGEYLKPSEEKGFYNFGMAVDLQDLNLTSAENRVLETLGNIKQCRKEFNIDHLSPSLIQTYIELMNISQSVRTEAPEEAAAEMSAYGLRIMDELIQSKPIIRFSLSPMEHHLGKLEVEGQFQIHQVQGPPLGKATATLYDIAGLEDRIQKEDILEAEKLKGIMDIIRQYFVQDKKGNGKLTLEVREGEPYPFLNDKPFQVWK